MELKLLADLNDVADLVSTFQVEMKEHNNSIISAIKQLTEQWPHSDEFQDFPWEDAHSLIKMLSLLLTLLTKRLHI